jgi:uncharacterized protein YbjT (DUF2867 family)
MSRPRNQAGPHRNLPREPIPLHVILPIREACRLLGWGARGLAAAKQQGLPVLRFSKWRYVATDDLLAFLRRVNRPPTTDAGGRKEDR